MESVMQHTYAMEQVLARQAVLADLRILAPLLDAYRVFYGSGSDVEAASRFLLERFNNGESVLFIAIAEDTAVGFCQLYPSFSSVLLARIFILNDLYVLESYRTQGIATMLLKAAAEFARELGAIRLTLSTAITNRAAQNLYEQAGWIRDQDFYVYSLKLSA